MDKVYRVTAWKRATPEILHSDIKFSESSKAAVEWMLWVAKGYMAKLEAL